MSCIKSVKFRVTAGNIHSFRIRSKETFRVNVSKVSGFGCDPKESTSVVDHLINDPFFDFSKEMKYRKIPKISPAMNKQLQI